VEIFSPEFIDCLFSSESMSFLFWQRFFDEKVVRNLLQGAPHTGAAAAVAWGQSWTQPEYGKSEPGWKRFCLKAAFPFITDFPGQLSLFPNLRDIPNLNARWQNLSKLLLINAGD
jgi:hypothetical protein